MPAIIESKNYFEFYSNENGYIEKIFFNSGDNVQKDQLLLIIRSPETELKVSQIELEIDQLRLEIDRQAGFKDNLNKRFVLEKTLQKKINEKEGLEKILKKLEIRATFSGKIYFSDNFREKQYINKKEPVFVLYDNTDYRIIGFCNENDFKLLKENSKSKFIFSSGDIKDIHSNITIISKISVPYLEYPELSSEYKGEIATRLENKKMRTEQAYYKVMIELDEKNLNLRSRETGTLVSQGESSSIITKVFKKAVSVFIRESEF